MLNNRVWVKYEGAMAHGYPATSWLQMGLLYACGVYTAREQGVFSRTQFYGRFWKHHYFDWITFLRRGGLYAGLGGLVAGTVMFGNPDVSLKRMIGKFNYWVKMEATDDRATINCYNIKDF